MGWGFTVPVRQGEGSTAAAPAPAPSFALQLEEIEEGGSGSDDEEYGIRQPGQQRQQQQQQQQQRQQQEQPASSGLSSLAGTSASGSSALGFTIDLDREFGGQGQIRSLFGFRTLNHVQSAAFPVVFQTDHNVVIAAPTGVGKTFLFELAIVRLLQEAGGDGEGRKPWKIVYVAPSKALCQQRLLDWQARFSKFGLRCVEVTGDNSGLRDVAAAQLILTTPEKCDSVSRDWRDNLFLLGSIRMLLIDEAHTLGDDPRGATLESLVCRLKIIKGNRQVQERNLPAAKMRILAASATLPNATDLGAWLGCPPEAVFIFDYTYRPVPLDVHVLGYASSANPFLFNRHLEERVLDVITRYSDGKSTIVFCESKKACESLANKLAATASALGPRPSKDATDSFAGVSNPKLRELLTTGSGQVAFHHAGISADDRACVERLFGQGQIRLLCSTSTLAVGINTPAHLVVIKGTVMWRGAGLGYEDMPVSSVLQMIGRAGRPGYDDRGVAVIMTSKDKQSRYEEMSAGQELVESQLTKRLHEVLNAEICSRVVADLDDALSWLQSTFLWVRMHKNPRQYNKDMPAGAPGDGVEARLRSALLKVLHDLDAGEMARFSDDDLTVAPLVAGKVMSKTLISYDSMKALRALPPDASLEELLWACCRCSEVALPLRKADKRPLNELLAKCRFRSKFKRCQLPSHKAFVLAQAALAGGGLDVQDFTLRVEQETIVENLTRIARAHREYAVETGKGAGAYISLLLGRSLRARLWEVEREAVLRQVEGIGPTLTTKLAAGGIKGFHDVLDTAPARLEALAGRRHPFGHELQHRVAAILGNALSMTVRQAGRARDAATLVVELRRDPLEAAAGGASASAAVDVLGAGPGGLGGRGARRLHFTLVAFASGPDRQLLLFRDINFFSAATAPPRPDGVGEGTEGDGEEEGGPPLHRIEFKVHRPMKLEGDDSGEVRGADKRFRITLALVSPYISLDCLQIFYPDFEGGGGGQHGVGAYGVEVEDKDEQEQTARGGGGGGDGGGSKKRKPQPKKVVKQSIEDDSPGSLPSLFKRQQQLLEQRAQEEAERREAQERDEAAAQRERERERERERAEREVAALRKVQLSAGSADTAPPPYQPRPSSATRAAAASAPAQRVKHEPQQRQPPPQQPWKRQPPPAPAQHGAAHPQPAPLSEPAQLPPPSTPKAARRVVGGGGADIFEQFRFTPESPVWDFTTDDPEPGEAAAASASHRAPAGPSSSSLSNSSSSSYRSTDTAAGSVASFRSGGLSSASASSARRPSASPSPRRSALEASTPPEIFMIKAKAREAHTDQVAIHRISKAASASSSSGATSRSGDLGPLLSHKVVGSSARASQQHPPPPAWSTPPSSLHLRRPPPQQQQHQHQQQPPQGFQPRGTHGDSGARYATGTGVVVAGRPASTPRHPFYNDDDEEGDGQEQQRDPPVSMMRQAPSIPSRRGAAPFRVSLPQQPPRPQPSSPPQAAPAAQQRVSWDSSLYDAAGGCGGGGGGGDGGAWRMPQRHPAPTAEYGGTSKKARAGTSGSSSSNSNNRNAGASLRHPLAPLPMSPPQQQQQPPLPRFPATAAPAYHQHHYEYHYEHEPLPPPPQQEPMAMPDYYMGEQMGGDAGQGGGPGVGRGEGGGAVSFDTAGFF